MSDRASTIAVNISGGLSVMAVFLAAIASEGAFAWGYMVVCLVMTGAILLIAQQAIDSALRQRELEVRGGALLHAHDREDADVEAALRAGLFKTMKRRLSQEEDRSRSLRAEVDELSDAFAELSDEEQLEIMELALERVKRGR